MLTIDWRNNFDFFSARARTHSYEHLLGSCSEVLMPIAEV
jgi:hypothetical protein